MRAISLVRVWLYSFRGFVVMTASLAIAFSFAVAGPPTDREVTLAAAYLVATADEVAREVSVTVAEVCPDLPADARVLCTPRANGPAPDKRPPEAQTRVVQPPERPEMVTAEADAPAAQVDLLGDAPIAEPPRLSQRAPYRTQRREASARSQSHAAVAQRASHHERERRRSQRSANVSIEEDRARDEHYLGAEEEMERDWRDRRRERRQAEYERRYDEAARADDEEADRQAYEEWQSEDGWLGGTQ